MFGYLLRFSNSKISQTGFESHTKLPPSSFSPPYKKPLKRVVFMCGGGEIRTHGPRKETPVFKTGAFDHSATPPIFFYSPTKNFECAHILPKK